MQKRPIAIGVATLVGAVTLAACGGSGGSKAASSPSATVPSTPDNKPAASSVNWPAPADASAQVKAAGLPMLGQEGQALHIHGHLDVFVNGAQVPVPADIGIDMAKQQISPLHTHDPSGVVHIESPVKRDFTLGEFMTEWNVPITKDSLGTLKVGDGKELMVYVNGKAQPGDPAMVKLHAHDEIAIVYGSPSDHVKVPSSYDWPQGL